MITIWGVALLLVVPGAVLVLRPGMDRSKLIGFVLLGVCILVCWVLMLGHLRPW